MVRRFYSVTGYYIQTHPIALIALKLTNTSSQEVQMFDLFVSFVFVSTLVYIVLMLFNTSQKIQPSLALMVFENYLYCSDKNN